MPIARRFTIKGRVQGVFFRASTREVAQSLGITGHAINLSNGNVEVLACGEAADLDKFAAWLNDGPPHAEVTEVVERQADWENLAGFRTG